MSVHAYAPISEARLAEILEIIDREERTELWHAAYDLWREVRRLRNTKTQNFNLTINTRTPYEPITRDFEALEALSRQQP